MMRSATRCPPVFASVPTPFAAFFLRDKPQPVLYAEPVHVQAYTAGEDKNHD